MALAGLIGLFVAAFLFTTSASAYPPGTAASVGVSASTIGPGGSLTVSGSGFKGTVTVTAADPILLATVTAGADGTFSARVTLPASEFPPGNYTITASDAYGDSTSVKVTIATAAAPSSPSTPSTGNGGLPFTGFAAASVGGLGVLLLIGGGIMLLAGRRRHATV